MLTPNDTDFTGGGGLSTMYGQQSLRPGQAPLTIFGANPPQVPSPSVINPPANTQTNTQAQQQGIYSQQERDAFINSSSPPSFFSPMSAEETAIVAAWKAKNGAGGGGSTRPPTGGGTGGSTPSTTPSTNPWGGNTSNWYNKPPTTTTPPSTTGTGGYGSGGGYGNTGGANSGAGNRPLYDYTYYRYNDGSQHLDQVNQAQGTMNEWNAMKNAWAKPTG